MRCKTGVYLKMKAKLTTKAPSKAEVYPVLKFGCFTSFPRGQHGLLRSQFYSWALLKANGYHLGVSTHNGQLSTMVRVTHEGKDTGLSL